MNKRNGLIVGLVILVLIVVVAIATNESGQQSSQVDKATPVVIGFSTPLSGDAASWGEPIKNGAQIAVDEINAVGGINGRTLQVIYEDDGCDAKKGVEVINKLILVDQVHAITGPPCSSPSLSMAPIANEYEVVFLTSGASSPEMADAGEYVFNIYPLDNLEFGYMADYIYNDAGVKSISILWLNNDYGKGAVDVFTQEYKGEIKAQESFLPDDTDFRTQLLKIKETNPDGLYVIANPSESPLIVKQINELGLAVQLFANGPAIETEDFDQEAKNLGEGLIYAMPAATDSLANVQLEQTYQEQFGAEAGFLPPLGYDSIMLLADAIEESGTDSDKIIDYLLGVENYAGTSGSLTFDSKGNIQKPFDIKIIESGQLVIIK